jgi:hypothetical protein
MIGVPARFRLPGLVLIATVASVLVACSSYQHKPHRLGPAAQLDNADYTCVSLNRMTTDDLGPVQWTPYS